MFEDIQGVSYSLIYPLFLSFYNKTPIFSAGFRKQNIYADTKFYENPSSGGRVVPCGQTDRLDEAFSNFSNAPTL